jgi:agmatine deiminase
MAWPSSGYTLGATPGEADEARATWAAVAHAIAEFEQVRMVVDPSAVDQARRWLSADVELWEAPLDDAWMRDIGPTFVLGESGLGAVDWIFNGWGAQEWAQWERDARVGRTIAAWAGATLIPSEMVNEGGGIQVDGAGTVLATRTVQLDPGRNPGWSQERVEAELRRTLGVETVVWLDRGLTRDYDEFGTRGHVDIVAAMPEPGVVLLHGQPDPAHPDHAVVEELRAAFPRQWRIVSVPAPQRLEDERGPVDHSYINHYVCNGGVVACSFGDPSDAPACELLAEAYPGRRVVAVEARQLFDRGGGVHCITQQQPAVEPAVELAVEPAVG